MKFQNRVAFDGAGARFPLPAAGKGGPTVLGRAGNTEKEAEKFSTACNAHGGKLFSFGGLTAFFLGDIMKKEAAAALGRLLPVRF